jgi:hypothetical protein
MKGTREDKDKDTKKKNKTEDSTFLLERDAICYLLSFLSTPDWLHYRIASKVFHIESDERRSLVRLARRYSDDVNKGPVEASRIHFFIKRGANKWN